MLSSIVAASADSEDIDLSSMTTEELIELKAAITDELNERLQEASYDEVWYDSNGVKITCTNYGVSNNYKGLVLKFDFTVENNSGKSIWAGINEDYVNGWKIGTTGNFCDNGVAPGKKIRSTQTIYLYLGDSSLSMDNVDDITEYSFVFWVDLDSDDWTNSREEFDKVISVFPNYDK